jgi:hypothetical protein
MRLSELIVIDDENDMVLMNGAKVAGGVFLGLSEPTPPGRWFRIVSVGESIVLESKRED